MKLNIIIITFLFFVSCKETSKARRLIKEEKMINMHAKKLPNAQLYSGALLRIDSLSSKYIKSRPVDIWLPENYSKDKKYAVLYMHDGQNLFDSTTTWNKQEWKVDEWATQLVKEGKIKDFIVVGIHNIPEIRWQDLFPQKAFGYLTNVDKEAIINEAKSQKINLNFNGDNYLKFLVEELKPIIDSEFSVFTNQENTMVSGSSMGGLMSMYAICEYPNIFGGAACLSTHWEGAEPKENNPVAKAILDYMESNLPNPESHKIYFDYGTKTLDAYYPKFTPEINRILKVNGYTSENSANIEFEGADHSENSWNKRLDVPLVFLLKN
ncbi:alpha/beta hydrolase [Algibacter sp. L4_22]|uniref:alpha/beta hydrolase n=1 Tax=Algibacter sp. L4_22 TaxID=2942477 RepID=UPI00201B5245|nr:alpha/beta hydrolase-fold protein [Algibacter sp. L4_22]MCL5127330.1 esterase family protein [Algibacter sp. L4_22]